MLSLSKTRLILKGLLDPLRPPWKEIKATEFTLPTLVPGGDAPGDPQAAECLCTSPALLLPSDAEKTPGYWNEGARRRLKSALALQPVAQRAKNIILFMGDGESPGFQPGRRHGW